MAEEIVELSGTEGVEPVPGNDDAVDGNGRLHDHEESENTQYDDVASEEKQKVDKMIENGDIHKLKMVRPSMLKGQLPNSLEKAMDYSSKFRKRSEKAQSSRERVQKEELQAIASSMEEYAFHLIEPLKKDHNKKQIFKLKFDHIAAKAVLWKQKKFLAHPVMYDLLRNCWKRSFRWESLTKFRWIVLLHFWTLFDMLLFPIIYFILQLIQVFGRVTIKRAKGSYRKTDIYAIRYHEYFETPYFIFVRDMLSYFALLVLHLSLCFQPSTLHFIVEEWIILVFFLGRFMMEVYQAVNGFSNYLRDSWNRLDVITLTIYAVLLILRVITWSVHTSISNNPLLAGAGYLYGINSMLLTLRVFGHIMELKAKHGAIQIALFQITENIIAVFGQLLIVIFAFSLAIFKIRTTQISFDGTPSTVFFESWWSIAKHLLWSFLLEPQVLHVPFERTIVFAQILYVLFLIIAVVMLMNMMIAILTNTYQRAERNAFDEWSYKKAATILTYYNYHPVPVPLNIISLTFLLMRYLYKKIRCRSSTVNIVKDPEKGGVQHRRSAQENDEKFKKMIIELESIHYTVHGDDFPIKTGNQLDHVVKQTDENRHLIGHIAERLFTHGPNRNEGAGSESRQEWDVKGIHILGNRLSYDSRDRHRCTIGDYEEYHGARYLAPLSPEMPGFEILIEEDSSINHRLILGVVDEVFDLNKIPKMEGNTVVYYTQKEQSFWPNIDHLPEMADRGDLLGCEILYGRESNGNLPVLFTLNGRVIWEGTIENGNPSTGRFYAFVGIGSKELSVRFKQRYLQQESHGVDQSSISLKQVLDQLSELKQEVRLQGIRSEIQNNAEKNV